MSFVSNHFHLSCKPMSSAAVDAGKYPCHLHIVYIHVDLELDMVVSPSYVLVWHTTICFDHIFFFNRWRLEAWLKQGPRRRNKHCNHATAFPPSEKEGLGEWTGESKVPLSPSPPSRSALNRGLRITWPSAGGQQPRGTSRDDSTFWTFAVLNRRTPRVKYHDS